jgi:hypothetical protein
MLVFITNQSNYFTLFVLKLGGDTMYGVSIFEIQIIKVTPGLPPKPTPAGAMPQMGGMR